MSERSKAHRAVARRLHPDMGGDTREYVAAMARVDAHFKQATGAGDLHVVTRNRTLSSLTRRAGRAASTIRTRLPRGWPGARRYGRL